MIELPIVTNADPKQVNDFYKTLLLKVQSLETLGKIERIIIIIIKTIFTEDITKLTPS